MAKRQTDYEKRRQHQSDLTWVHGLVASAQKRGWYGVMTFKMEEGVMRRAITEESHIPPKAN